MKNSIRQLTFLFYTFHLSPRVLLSRIRPAKIMRIPSKSFLLSFPPIEFPSLDRRSTLAFLKFATASFDLFAAQPLPQFLPTRFSHRIDGIDGGSENWLNEVEGGGAQRSFRDVPNVLAKNRRVCVYLGRVGSIDSART